MFLNLQRIVCFVVVVVLMVGVSYGQRTTATFAGIVTDTTGAVLPGADVDLVNEGTAAVMKQLTNETGEFVFSIVPAGTYTLKIGMMGFKAYESRAIPLAAAQNVRRTYVLEVGSVTDSVTVTGEAALVNALSPEQNTNYGTLVVGSMPLSNRNVSKILEITPGLTRDATTAGAYGGRVRLNGLGGSSVRITANGTDASGNSGTPGMSQWQQFNKIDVMSVEAVGEIQVVKGVFSAEYGPTMAGNVNISTKSGTNVWHGSAFHRYEGALLDARNPFLKDKPNLVWNQYGGSLGGPIKKDRLFFFGAYEGYSQRAPRPLNGNVPTERFRQIMLQALPYVETQLNLDALPLPNVPVSSDALLGVWRGARREEADDDHVDARVDMLLGGGTLFGVYTRGHPSLVQPKVTLNSRRFDSRTDRWSVSYILGKGAWTSESRYGYNRNQLFREDAYINLRDPAKAETIPFQRRVPTLMFPGMENTSSERLDRGRKPTYSVEQQFAVLRGSHSLKFGGLVVRQGGGRLNGVHARATFQTLQDIQANRLTSLVVQFTANPFTWTAVQSGFFLQDDWRVNSKLVLNLGMRYDRFGRTVARPIDPAYPSGYYNRSGLLDAVNFKFGPVRDPEHTFEDDNSNISPRFGFAYNIDGTGKTVVRGGFGVMFQSLDPYTVEQSVSNPRMPFSQSFSAAEIANFRLRFPVYNEDLFPIVQADDEKLSRPVIDPNIEAPYAMNFSLGVQRALTSNMVLETGFVGTRGVKFLMYRTYNQPDPVTGIRPNPSLGQSEYYDNSQQTSYYSWQTSLQKRFSKNLMFNVNHTWGKGLSYTGGDISKGSTGDSTANVQDFLNVRAEHGPSSGDITHLFIANWVYHVPPPAFIKGFIGKQILGGWEVSGLFKGRTGAPFDVSQSSSRSGGRPDLLDFNGAINRSCCGFGNLQYLNTTAFQKVPVSSVSRLTTRRGSLGHNALREPGFQALDLSLAKNVSLVRESKTLQIRADISNLLNHVNYTGLVTGIDSVNFGQVTGTSGARTIQLQLRLSF